jgi:Ca2+-binding RTX toxin-like protein
MTGGQYLVGDINYSITGIFDRTVTIENASGTDIIQLLQATNPNAIFLGDVDVFDVEFLNAINNAFSTISNVADVTFVQSMPQDAYMYINKVSVDWPLPYFWTTIGNGTAPKPISDGAAVTFFEQDEYDYSQRAADGGAYKDYAAIHEILHSLGLSHPHDTGNGTTVLDFQLDSARFTVMSYHIPGRLISAPSEYGFPVTPMALDISALQFLYGEKVNNSGDTQYQWIEAGQARSISGNGGVIKLGRGYYSIWDTSGSDTIDFSLANSRSLINLNAASLDMAFSSDYAAILSTAPSAGLWATLPLKVQEEIASQYSNFGGFLSTTFTTYLAPGGFSIANQNAASLFDAHIENAVGSNRDDVIIGNQFDNAILGNAGNDLIFGGGGVDAIDGGTGNDEIYGGADDDILLGGAGDDTIIGGAGADAIDGGTNTATGDTVSYVGSTAVKVNLSSFGPQSGGDAEGDTLKGIENFIGSAEGDEIEGSDISNWLRGFGGDDTFFIRTAKGGNLDILNGGDGSDTLDLSLATFAERIFDPNGVDQFRFIADLNTGSVRAASMSASLISIENINGSDLADKLIGNAGVNIINGGGGSDWIFGGAGADIIDGGAGRNKINYIDSIAAVDIDLNRVEQIGGHAQGDQLFNILEVDGSNFADSIRLRSEGWGFVWAAGGNDRIYGGTGENIVYGDVGNDTFYYGGGKSTFYGGIGTNTLDLSLVDKGYLFDLGYVPKVVLANISQQNADETINFFETSRVVGSEGNDTFKMYNKGFFVDGGGGYDTVDLTNLNFNVGKGMTFNMIDGTIKNSVGAFATFANIENFIGSQGDDNFISYGPNGHFFGGNGLDVLWASEYAEWFDGGSVTDRIDYRNSNAAVNVDLGRAVQHGGYAEGDQLFDVEVVVGSNFNDTIDLKSLGHTAVGLDGDDDIFVFNNDTAFGDAGEDHIYINGRYNTIYGGADQDTFHVKGAFDSTQIKDYEYGEQIIFEGYAPGSVTVRVSAEDVYLSFYQQTLYLRGAGYNHAQFSADDILFA